MRPSRASTNPRLPPAAPANTSDFCRGPLAKSGGDNPYQPEYRTCISRHGGGGPRYAANPGLTPNFRRSLPKIGCLSQGLPRAIRHLWSCPVRARARSSPHSDYNRDYESHIRAHSPEELLKSTIVLAIASLCAWLFVALPSGRPAETARRPHFTDVAARSKISYLSNNSPGGHKYFPQPMCGGVALFDFDNDGRLDIFFTNGAQLPEMKKTNPSY